MLPSARSRSPSPSPTIRPGLSNDHTQSYHPAWPSNDYYRQVSKTHFDEFRRYLASYSARTLTDAHSSAILKLRRLTIDQFYELSTDVYDELVRRNNEVSVPHLPAKPDFHPKRNIARQKLAILPTTRFEDMTSDVYFEVGRRYPEFKELEDAGSLSVIIDSDLDPESRTIHEREAVAAEHIRPNEDGTGQRNEESQHNAFRSK